MAFAIIAISLLHFHPKTYCMILVTGATGLVGSQLLQQLIAQQQKVKALYRSSIPFKHALVEWVKADILDIVA